MVVAAADDAADLIGASVAFADVPFANAELVSVPLDQLLLPGRASLPSQPHA